MMFERFTADARATVVQGQEHSRRLGHRYIGCEHLLLALVGTDQPAAAVLREHGVTPEGVEEEIVRRVGLGAGSSLFADLDRDALAAMGIDLDAVRARIETSFGPDALTRADQAVHHRPRPSRLNPRRAMPRHLVHHWQRRHRTGGSVPTVAVPAATGLYQATGPRVAGHIPFIPDAKKILAYALREALARHDNHIGVEHIALSLVATSSGQVPPILSALGASAPALRAAILDRYRQAS
jgi:ATP-dependent Clp protease ATP-binding subunit ClpA